MTEAAGRLTRMLAVGGLATGLYAASAWAITTASLLPAAPASLLAYALASALSYTAHRRLTFASERPHAEALPRFLALNLAGYLTALAVPALATGVLGGPVWAAILATCAIVPAVNCLGLSRLVFPAATRAPRAHLDDCNA